MGLTPELLPYEIARDAAAAKWNTLHPDTPACYAQEVKFSELNEWRISDVTAAIVGYVKLREESGCSSPTTS